MRMLPFLLSAIATTGLVWVLNTQLPSGSSKTPRLGYFLSPQHGFWQNAEPTNTNYSGEIKLAGLKGKADVYIDDRLVPHIYAEQDADAYMIQGYLHAKFRLWQMEFQTHVAAGRLSEILGEARLETDRYFRRLGMVYAAEKALGELEKDPAIKEAVNAYAKGVNAYISTLDPTQLPFEYKLMDYQPEAWTTLKTALFLKFMAFDLSARGASTDLQMSNARNYFSYEDMQLLYPAVQDSLDPIVPKGTAYATPSVSVQTPTSVDQYLGKKESNAAVAPIVPDKNNGSNNWAIGGSRTQSGRPILCNDPHLGLNLPSLWYEVQITTPTHSTYGASFPGSPAVIIGFNDSISWGVTNAGRDVIDYYEIKFKDSTMQEYWFNNAWVKAKKRKEIIQIKGGKHLEENIAMTVFGPVMYDKAFQTAKKDGQYLALRWKAHDPSNELRTFYGLNRAKNLQDYRTAIEYFECPGQNFVYADKKSNIAITQQGAFVARWKHQGDHILPGTDSSFVWQGIIPDAENARSINPARDFVSSANQMATDATYPYYLGAPSNFPLYRGIIINRKLAGIQGATAATMQALQTDNYNVFAEYARPVLQRYLTQLNLSSSEQKYITILNEWNLDNGVNEKGATVFRVLWDSLETAVWNDEIAAANTALPWPDESTLLESLLRDSTYKFADDIRTLDTKETVLDGMRKALTLAIPKLEELDKANKLAWGTFKATHVDHLTKTPALSRLNLPIGGGVHIINATTNNHGPSWRMIVHMTDEIEAYGVYPGGQSGNPGSKFYDSFVDSWATGKYYRLQFVNKAQAAKSMPWHIQFTN